MISNRKRIKYLKKAIKQIKSVLDVLRYRYFWEDEEHWDDFRKNVTEPLLHQLKMLQEQLDKEINKNL